VAILLGLCGVFLFGLGLEGGLGAFVLAALHEAEDEPDKAEGDEENNKNGEPNRADEEEVLEGMDLVKEDDGLSDAVEADREGAGVGEVPVQDAGAGGAGEDNEGFGEGGLTAIFGRLEDFVIGEEVANREGLAGVEVDVAVVFDGANGGEGAAEDETREVMGG